MTSMTHLLGPEGPFPALVAGFLPRQEQQEMAEAIARAMEEYTSLIAEAGTGTGKTFAYLVPALLSGNKVIISTGTKNLQDQLFHKDLPVVVKALARPVRTALLKGRENYLCPYRLRQAESEGRFLNRQQVDELQRIREWQGKTRSGDIADQGDIAEDSAIWSWVTANGDNCLGGECPDLDDCFMIKARQEAQAADILVVNHHLFFADLALKGEGVGELLPSANAVIFDEAHQLPEIAGNFFGSSISSRQLQLLVTDCRTEYHQSAGDMPGFERQLDQLQTLLQQCRLAFGVQTQRAAWQRQAGNSELHAALAELDEGLVDLEAMLEELAQRSKGLELCLQRCGDLRVRLSQLTGVSGEDVIHWYETYTRSFLIAQTPLDIAPIFSSYMQAQKCALIFTSATLAVGNRFDHYQKRLGLEQAQTGQWQSPFDYPRQAVLYVPEGLPEPQAPEYTALLVERVIPVLQASRGRAFVLFTSHRALNLAAQLLQERIEYPIMVQGSLSKNHLLEKFRTTPNAVLLATGSFWEGVDVRGEALSCVVIDKLPFASPDDPLLEARLEALRRQGGNPFFEYQVPQAVIALKQGVGRLIRDVEDRGVMMICDPRLVTKSYGRIFLDSLPPMTRTRKLSVVERFFRFIDKEESCEVQA